MSSPTAVTLYRLEAEADEMCSFVGKKTNKQWLWLAMDTRTRQVIAFRVGDRSRKSAEQLWVSIPAVYREQATFYTDCYEVYTGVIPAAQHQAITKLARKTNHLARFNNTLRQRVSRLVRDTLAFSKKLANHICAITGISSATTIPQEPQHYMDNTTERIVVRGEVPSPLRPPAGCVFRPRCPDHRGRMRPGSPRAA